MTSILPADGSPDRQGEARGGHQTRSSSRSHRHADLRGGGSACPRAERRRPGEGGREGRREGGREGRSAGGAGAAAGHAATATGAAGTCARCTRAATVRPARAGAGRLPGSGRAGPRRSQAGRPRGTGGARPGQAAGIFRRRRPADPLLIRKRNPLLDPRPPRSARESQRAGRLASRPGPARPLGRSAPERRPEAATRRPADGPAPARRPLRAALRLETPAAGSRPPPPQSGDSGGAAEQSGAPGAGATADPVATGAQAAGGSDGALPFTGSGFPLLVALGLLGLAAGLVLRRVTRRVTRAGA